MTLSLILKPTKAARPSFDRREDEYDIIADGSVVGRIFKARGSASCSRAGSQKAQPAPR